MEETTDNEHESERVVKHFKRYFVGEIYDQYWVCDITTAWQGCTDKYNMVPQYVAAFKKCIPNAWDRAINLMKELNENEKAIY